MLRSSRDMIGRLALEKGAALLITALLLIYWGPVLWWLGATFLSERSRLPADFPFASLARRTVVVSLVTAVGSTALAYSVALLWRIASAPLRSLLSTAMVVPMVMGALARNYSWRAMLASHEPVASLGWSWLHGPNLQYTELSVFIVMTCVFVPVAFFILVQGSSAATQDQVDAARVMGATEDTIIRSVICPHMNRAVTLCLGLVFSMASGYFITPQMVGGSKVPLMGNAVYVYVNLGEFGIAAAIGLWFLAIMIGPVALVMVFSMRQRILSMGR